MMNENNNEICVTIGMPIYNGAEYIREALEFALKQTYKNYKIVISDNCSTDETAIICKEFTSSNDNITYYKQEKNIGATGNFNYLINTTDTDYFILLAHDDYWESDNYLENLVQVLEKNKDLALAYSRARTLDMETKKEKWVSASAINNKIFINFLNKLPLLNSFYFYLDRNPFKIYGLYRTKCLQNIRFKPFLGASLNAENVFLYKLIKSNKIFYIDNVHFVYRVIVKPKIEYSESKNYRPPTFWEIEREFLKNTILLEKKPLLYLMSPILLAMLLLKKGLQKLKK